VKYSKKTHHLHKRKISQLKNSDVGGLVGMVTLHHKSV